MLEGLRYFARERKSDTNPKPAYHWGTTGGDLTVVVKPNFAA